jgi:hypothetical protein
VCQTYADLRPIYTTFWTKENTTAQKQWIFACGYRFARAITLISKRRKGVRAQAVGSGFQRIGFYLPLARFNASVCGPLFPVYPHK